jgi:hypothetical protein
MSRLALPLAFVWLASLVACFSADGDGDGGGSGGSAGGDKSSGGSSGSVTSGGSSAGEGGTTSSSGGVGGTQSGSGGSGGSGGSAGSATSCVTETIVLGQSPTSECGYAVPVGVGEQSFNLYYGSSVGSGSLVCWRASSQGCTPHGYWLNGGDILLCDETCGAFADNPGQTLYIEVGCEMDSCL